MLTRRAIVAALPLTLAVRPAFATEEQDLVDRARITVEGFVRDAEFAEMRRLLPRAKGVIVFPSIFKGAFIIGGEGGNGVLVGRDTNTGAWTAPSFLTMGAGSVGLQIGAEASEVILLIMTDNGLRAVLSNQVKLGADASIAVGPIGKGVEASTTTALRADIYSFAKSRGLFGGVSLEGAVLASRDSMNQRYYGRAISAEQIILRRQVEAPNAALLQDALRRAEAKA